ncbi:hypothetical protein ACZ87_03935 [Candidatus Erwinia dacicola]|uniref:Uncharacterized protein n=1 Tax=Candidatus Erwinia dacicola TaxID=252393 RepID=A0A328TES7_9GAMM|nr:hypothetical protein ACZ87_03935 [Candidatus Erwinia dacicola]
MGSYAAPSTKQWHQFTIARSLQQCHIRWVYFLLITWLVEASSVRYAG